MPGNLGDKGVLAGLDKDVRERLRRAVLLSGDDYAIASKVDVNIFTVRAMRRWLTGIGVLATLTPEHPRPVRTKTNGPKPKYRNGELFEDGQ